MITSPQVKSTIDPTEGLVQYVQAIKPYHTKILEVLVEYVYTDAISVTIQDSMVWNDGFMNGIVTQVRPLPTTITSPINIVTFSAVNGGSLYTNGVYNHILLDNVPVVAGFFVIGKVYIIASIGTTNFTLVGAASNTIGLTFTATGIGTGTGTVIGTGTGAKANITVTSGAVTFVEIVSSGRGYTVGDLLTTVNTNIGGTGSGFVVTVQSSDLHAATTITESLLFDFSLDFRDDISAVLTDIRPVGYGLDPYSAPGGSFGSPVDPDGLSITVVGSGGAAFTGSISGTTLTVTTIAGVLTAGQTVLGLSVAANTVIVSQLTGTIGGIGTYTVSGPPQIVGSEPMSTDASTFTLPVGGLDLDPFDE